MVLLTCGYHHGGGRASPVVLTVGQPQPDTVIRLGFNAYAAQVTAGALYKISITSPTSDTDLLVFGTDSSYRVLATCAINNTSIIGTSPEDCVIVAQGNALYFAVDGTFITPNVASYTIDIELLPGSNLTFSTPVLDSTTQTGAKRYAVPVSPGVTYTIGITGLTDDVDLYVFGNDNTFSAQAICSIDNTLFTGTTPEDCTLTSSGNTFYFIVDGIFSSTATIQYTALTTPTPIIPVPSNEGTIGSPIVVTVNTSSTGQVAYSGTSYYAVGGLSAGTRYTVSIIGLTGNANLKVFGSDSTFTTLSGCLSNNTFFREETPEDCTVISPGTTMYFSVIANTTSGGVAFINLVEPGP